MRKKIEEIKSKKDKEQPVTSTVKPVSKYDYDQIPEGVNLFINNMVEKESINNNVIKNVNSIIAIKQTNKSFYSNKSNEKNSMILINDQSVESKTREEELAEIERYEEEQRKLFQDAVMEFRNRNNDTSNNVTKNDLNNHENINSLKDIPKKVKFNLENSDTKTSKVVSQPNKFLYSVNTNENDNDLFDFGKIIIDEKKSNSKDALIPIFEKSIEEEVEVNSNEKSCAEINKNLLPFNSIKTPCFTCYKLVELKDLQESNNYSSSSGTFCSSLCERTFIDENIVSNYIVTNNLRKYAAAV